MITKCQRCRYIDCVCYAKRSWKAVTYKFTLFCLPRDKSSSAFENQSVYQMQNADHLPNFVVSQHVRNIIPFMLVFWLWIVISNVQHSISIFPQKKIKRIVFWASLWEIPSSKSKTWVSIMNTVSNGENKDSVGNTATHIIITPPPPTQMTMLMMMSTSQ